MTKVRNLQGEYEMLPLQNPEAVFDGEMNECHVVFMHAGRCFLSENAIYGAGHTIEDWETAYEISHQEYDQQISSTWLHQPSVHS